MKNHIFDVKCIANILANISKMKYIETKNETYPKYIGYI